MRYIGQRIRCSRALLLLVCVYGHAQGAAGESLSPKEMRRAGAEARTPEDHLRLAAYYTARARQAQAALLKTLSDVASERFPALTLGAIRQR